MPVRHCAARLGCLSALALLATLGCATASAQGTASRPKVCLVLSGGGARGVAHVGVLKVLEELRVPVDCIVGTSMGALVGGAYAAGVAPAVMEQRIRAANWDDLLSDAPPRPRRSPYSKELEREQVGSPEFGVSRRGLKIRHGAILGQQLELFLQSLIGGDIRFDSFQELPIPYRAVATDITSGRMVVLERGSLSSAMRASMSVPGVFAPQRVGGQLLVDGMLVRNLPVDVARAMGADVIIAVNLGSSLLKPEEVESIFGVAEQTLQILTEQNVERSLAELTPADVLIVPQLGDFASGDFKNAASTIPIGVAAARAQETALRRLSLDEAGYAAWAAVSRQPLPERKFAAVELDTSQLGFVAVTAVRAEVQTTALKAKDSEKLHDTIDQLLASDDFERVRLRAGTVDGQSVLTIQPVAKSWGPDYYHLGLGLSTDFSGESSFELIAAQRLTWLNSRGLEWRNQLELGDVTGLHSELREPFDAARRWFVSPWVSLSQRNTDIYFDNDAIARYREREGWAGVDLGRTLGSLGELRFGYEFGELRGDRTVGDPLFPRIIDHIGALHAGVVLDDLDVWNFPRSGRFVSADIRVARTALGSENNSEKVSLEFQQAFGDALNSLLLGARYGGSWGTPLSFMDAFELGGFQDLSGFRPRAFLAENYLLGQLIYQRQVIGAIGPLHALYAGTSLEGADLRDVLNTSEPPGFVWGTSLFIAADTSIGPLYLGVGLGKGGDHALYLFLGRP